MNTILEKENKRVRSLIEPSLLELSKGFFKEFNLEVEDFNIIDKKFTTKNGNFDKFIFAYHIRFTDKSQFIKLISDKKTEFALRERLNSLLNKEENISLVGWEFNSQLVIELETY